MKKFFLLVAIIYFGLLLPVYGGERAIPAKDINFNSQTGEINYELTVPALVRVRVGVSDGPLYSTVLNWQPESIGKHKEIWDGKDMQKQIILMGRNDVVATFNYITDDDNTFDPKELLAAFPMANNTMGHKLPAFSINRIHKNHKRDNCRDVMLDVDFLKKLPKTKDGFYIVSKKMPVKMSFKPADEKMFRDEHYSIHVFVDDVLVAGELDGYAPYHWVFDATRLNQGKHVIIINCSGYDDHYGVGVLPVYVKR